MSAGGHVLYAPADFTPEEAARRNQLYVLVVEGGLGVCKRCGAGEVELDRFPTCRDYWDHRKELRRGEGQGDSGHADGQGQPGE